MASEVQHLDQQSSNGIVTRSVTLHSNDANGLPQAASATNPMPVSQATSGTIAAVSVEATSTTVATIDVSSADRVYVEIVNADVVLTAFAIDASTDGSSFNTLFSAAGEFTVPSGALVGASGNLTVLGVETGWFIMVVTGIKEIRVVVNSGGTTSVSGTWSAS